MKRLAHWWKIIGGLGVLWSPVVQAQWRTQEVPLRPGWNAVYLHVQPLPADCDTQFAGTPVAEAHRFNQRVRVALFDSDPSKPFRRPAEWLTWRPSDGTESPPRTLANLTGDTAYLIRATNAHVWRITGRPVLPAREWVSGIPNLVGFPIDPSASPTFAEFFAAEPRLPVVGGPADLLVQDIDANLNGVDLTTRTRRQTVSAGRAYWIRARASSRFVGPLVVTTSDPSGLLFGDDANELRFQVRNVSSNAMPVTLRHAPSETPPPGMPRKEGDVPLSVYSAPGPSGAGGGWERWGVGETKHATLGPGEQWQLRVAVDRSALGSPAASTNTWQSLVQVTGGGLHVEVPVNAAKAVAGGGLAAYPTGLWIGEVSITNVTYVRPTTVINADGSIDYGPEQPTNGPVRQAFPLRLILHWNGHGIMRLLPRAVIALGGNESNRVLRVFSSEHHPRFQAGHWTALSRVSSPALATLGSGLRLERVGGAWVGAYTTPADDPLNPYRHVYHPRHASGLQVSNLISFTLDTPADGSSAAVGPDETLRGTYGHQINGLRDATINLLGSLTFRRVAAVDALDSD